MSKKVLTIAAHPDDEILGCGGAMARHVAEGDELHVLILAEGLTSRDQARDRAAREGELSELARTAQQANALIGASSCTLLDFPDNRMDGVELLDIVKQIEAFVDKLQPDLVYTHFAGDLNIDHGRVSQAVATACRPVPGQSVKEIYFFEVPSSTEWQLDASAAAFRPDYFVDLGAGPYLNKKLEALKIYAGEMRDFPHARSLDAVEALARWRGASVGVVAAEAFATGRVLR